MKLVYGFLVLGLTLGAVTVEAHGPRGARGSRPDDFDQAYGPTCKILNQSGSLFDGCRESGEWRCYADIRFENGRERKIRGGCTTDLSQCWSSGRHGVWPSCRE